MNAVCSYCQREYGTLSIGNKPIFRTFDHLKPLLRKTVKGKTRNRRGIMCRGIINVQELTNLLQCCNECNQVKGAIAIHNFYNKLKNLLKNKTNKKPNHPSQYLTQEIVETIKCSISILKTKPQPVNLPYLI